MSEPETLWDKTQNSMSEAVASILAEVKKDICSAAVKSASEIEEIQSVSVEFNDNFFGWLEVGFADFDIKLTKETYSKNPNNTEEYEDMTIDFIVNFEDKIHQSTGCYDIYTRILDSNIDMSPDFMVIYDKKPDSI